jgi:uncharacterized integral membrane protein
MPAARRSEGEQLDGRADSVPGSASQEAAVAGPGSTTAPDVAEQEAGRPAETPQSGPRKTRISSAFVATCAGLLVLVLLLIFILENTESVRINFLGAHGHISLGVALLGAAVGGSLIVGMTGAARVMQLRLQRRRELRRR